MIRLLLTAGTFAALSACTTARVETEFGQLTQVATKTEGALRPVLAPRIASEKDAELTAAAAAGDIWILTDECAAVLNAQSYVDPAACKIEKLTEPGKERQPGPAMAVQRKLDAIGGYLSALELLMDSGLEVEVTTNYAAALGALADLNAEADSGGLAKFLAKRKADQNKVNAVVREGVAALRFAKMRSIVTQHDQAFGEVLREVQLLIIQMDLAPGFASAQAGVLAADEVLISLPDTAPVAQRRAAMVGLQNAHAAYLKAYETSVIYQLGLIARNHHTLAKALKSPGSTDEVIEYLKTLKELSDTLKG